MFCRVPAGGSDRHTFMTNHRTSDRQLREESAPSEYTRRSMSTTDRMRSRAHHRRATRRRELIPDIPAREIVPPAVPNEGDPSRCGGSCREIREVYGWISFIWHRTHAPIDGRTEGCAARSRRRRGGGHEWTTRSEEGRASARPLSSVVAGRCLSQPDPAGTAGAAVVHLHLAVSRLHEVGERREAEGGLVEGGIHPAHLVLDL